MSRMTRVLMVEDNPADAELALRELKRASIASDARRVETFADYRRELEAFQPHVILCDFSMPRFDGLEALGFARRSYPDIPFIFVSGTIGEEAAVVALKNGAKDYVLKGNLLRLSAAVERAIKETEERGVRRAHERALRAGEKLYRTLFEHHPYPIMLYDIGTLRFLALNNAAVKRYGYSREEMLKMTVMDIMLEKDHSRLLDHRLPAVSNPGFWQHRTKNRERFFVEMAFHDLVFEGRAARVAAVTGFLSAKVMQNK